MNTTAVLTEALTHKQRLVFDQLVLGKNNKEIATAVDATEKTVKQHITAILKKFGCDSRCRLVARHYRGELQENIDLFKLPESRKKALPAPVFGPPE